METIGICVGHKNRSDMLVSCLLESLNRCDHQKFIQLSVFDCGTPGIEEKIKDVWKGSLILNSNEMNFTRTHSLNKAVEQSTASFVFLCDVDMILPVGFVRKFHENVGDRKAWFPICFSLRKAQPPTVDPDFGWWRDTGFGMAGFRKEDYLSLGGHDLKFTTYGEEDIDLFRRAKASGIISVRENCVGLFHQWHQKTKFGVDVF